MKTKNIRKLWNIIKILVKIDIKGTHSYPKPWTINIIRINYKKQVSKID